MGQEENITSHQFDNPRSPMYSDDTFLDVDYGDATDDGVNLFTTATRLSCS